MYTLMYLQTVCFTHSFINTSQQYGRSPVCTPLCAFRLYALLDILLTHHNNMDAPQYVHLMHFQTVCFTECFINTSQQYGRSPVCTPLCTFRLYALLNVLFTTPHDTYIPQYVSHVKKKKGSNIAILKRGKNIMKCQLQISYTNIISAHLCSLSNSINHFKPNDF